MIESSTRRFLILLTFSNVLLLATTGLPEQDTSARRVRFPNGRTTVVLKATVENDGMNRYIFGAKVGQSMSVHITSPRTKAQFDVYPRNEQSALVGSGAEDQGLGR
jgi:hypothetical protein